MTHWRPVQAVPCLSSSDSWDGPQPCHDPELDKLKKMDELQALGQRDTAPVMTLDMNLWSV